MSPRDDATERQVIAADPLASTWLSANAGSGKTRVLTDRVARLLLTGLEPQHILCLTYTKAAASEMQNRLFRRLGGWAMKPDDALRAELRDLGEEGTIDAEHLRTARRLFARAIETPGGLKIQTIHSFCASLLRRFPLEARVSPQFTEMDDRAALLLREQIVEEMADGPLQGLIDGMAAHHTGEDFAALTAEVCRLAADFGAAPTMDAVLAGFGLPPRFDEQAAIALAFDGSEPALFGELLPMLRGQSATYQKLAAALATINVKEPGPADFDALCDAFLYKSGDRKDRAKVGGVPQSNHKAAREALEPILPELDAFMERIEAARFAQYSLYTARKTFALHQFAAAFLPEYERRKQARGWLDFDDLILKARQLLTDPAVAQWVLFRLDGGIDHILVDEAQDTSPTQWAVIESLAQEFTAGTGAREDVERTIFVVGDKKQSIYSFQGADPGAFDRMRDHFAARLAPSGRGLQALQLEYSFRSSPAVLQLVDKIFEGPLAANLGDISRHIAFNRDLPGRCDLWPLVEKTEKEEPGDWFDPVDKPSEDHHSVRLARMIAGEIKRMIDSREPLPQSASEARAVQPGDFLILVQRRSALFHEIIRACKEQGLEIAGADRLKVGGELAVKDIIALLAFLALPEDDLSLAAALRSPLFGWSEQQLYTLAQGRGARRLWQALREARDQHTDTLAVLDDLRREADFLRPFELIERLLTRHQGRYRLLSRLGEEAEDGIDALLDQALSYENSEVPSLTGFLAWLQSEEVEIKRQLDSGGGKIRVMTVHGSKGLEAPIVILPDTGQRPIRLRDDIYRSEDGLPMWKVGGIAQPAPMEAAMEAEKAVQYAERMRLLYVAATRAEKWLITCACGDLGKSGDTWFDLIEAGLKAAGAVEQDFFGAPGLRLETGAWPQTASDGAGAQDAPLPDLPEWAAQRAQPRPSAQTPVLTPSDLGGAKALAGVLEDWDEEAALQRGTAIHLLLEHLPDHPESLWPEMAQRLFQAAELPTGDMADMLAEAAGVIKAPHLAMLFDADTLAEVDLTAPVAALGGQRIQGTVDRLIVTPERVTVVDFKTNQLVPKEESEVPEGLLRQMGAYVAALEAIFPGREIAPAILWTRDATLMPLSHEAVMAALGRTATS
ncbi:double-strand break repair helicase AddA [Pseudoruegeria sp. SHC-113]|uniref:double-strand break repair helicase AddA n=1 Tax=Pseudoruegeria sp. SHC-113 TaxID=2855439 RepID=UPI0021BA712D|nr:double-strand break repair helicase AddA [Pseudoruegeria sp. SHC-113]MCT8158596.1 double-strand break repair helicase AddA [Pseudoruegeria sp. SHC-113]